jgi:hypothetical protein
MDREYDIFECQDDGSVSWRATVRGLPNAKIKLEELAGSTGNDHIIMYVPTQEIIARVDATTAKERTRKPQRILQVAYDEQLGNERAALLRRFGYHVFSVIGNESAKVLFAGVDLNPALVIVGHAAPEQTRREIVDWFKQKYPQARVLALNPRNQELIGADYNVVQNGPEKWLPFVLNL